MVETNLGVKSKHILTFFSLNSCMIGTDGFHLYRATSKDSNCHLWVSWATTQQNFTRKPWEDVQRSPPTDKQTKSNSCVDANHNIFLSKQGHAESGEMGSQRAACTGHSFYLPPCVFLSLFDEPLEDTGLYPHWQPQVPSPYATSSSELLGLGVWGLMFPGVLCCRKLIFCFQES